MVSRMLRVALVFSSVLAITGPARAYVRITTERGGSPVLWLHSCISVRADGRGSIDVPLPQVDAALARAANNWTSRTSSCSFLQLVPLEAGPKADVAIDGQPTIVFRDEAWRRPGASMEHDPSSIGLTSVFYVDTPGARADGTILDADIELNGVYFTFTTTPMTATPRPGTTIADLENTLTHELGHVQGLAHTCWDHVRDAPPLDDQGQMIPDCNGPVPDAIRMTTMFPYASMPGETSKRHLSDDDVRGICEIYPASAPPPACYGLVEGGCAVARRRPPPLTLELAFALALLWARRRWA
jgi:hypothetical protein